MIADRDWRRDSAAAVDRVHRYWFESVDLGPFVLARTLFGMVVVYWALSMVPSVSDFFGPQGIDPSPPLAWWKVSVLRYLPDALGPWIVVVLLAATGVALTVGRLTRIAGPLAWVLITSLYHDNRIIWNGGDDLVRLIALYLGLFCLTGPAARGDVPLFVRHAGGKRVRAPGIEGPVWVLRLLRIQLVVIYVSTVLEKMRGTTWFEGTATLRALQIRNMERFPIPGVFRVDPYLNNVITWATLILEVLLPVLLLRRSTRRLAIAVGVVFHLLIEYALRVGVFSWAMVVLYLAFLSAEDARELRLRIGRLHPVRRLQSLLPERKRPEPVPAGAPAPSTPESVPESGSEPEPQSRSEI